MLSDSDLVATEFFNWNFTPRFYYNDTAGIECYYLLNEGGTMAVGWVHNLSAWTMNNYYLAKGDSTQNFLGCTTPDSQAVSLPGFVQDHDFYITWFPTRINAAVPTNDTVISTLAGDIRLDFSDQAMNGVLNNYLDTLHSDYAFVIAPYPVLRSMEAVDETDSITAAEQWDFMVYPNPAVDEWSMIFSDDFPKDIVIYDLSGRRLHAWNSMSGKVLRIPTGQLARGAYAVHVRNGISNKVKKLIIR